MNLVYQALSRPEAALMTQTNQQHVPTLRFPEFDSDQNRGLPLKKFSQLFAFSSGKNIKQGEASPDYNTPCVRYGELYHLYGEVITKIINKTNLPRSELKFSEGNEILLPSAGEDPFDISSASALTLDGVAIGRTINVLKPLEENVCSHIFVSYYINAKLRKRISCLARGSSISNVYNSDLQTLKIHLPTLPEQIKIAGFLGAVDKKIAQLTEKKRLLEDYKKGCMQQLFSQKIRFKDEKGNDFPDWEEKRLGEVLSYEQPTKYLVSSSEYSNEHKTPVLTAGKTFILGYTDEKDGIFSNLPVIIFDDFTTAFKFVDFPFKAKSSAMKMLSLRSDDADIRFVHAAMLQIEFRVGEHKRYWISEYQNEVISYPHSDEQRKIADFLSTLDLKIELVAEELKQAKTFKKGLLQQMFI